MVRIGLVMLQGARHVHATALKRAAEQAGVELELHELRTDADLFACQPEAIVLPGGETTTMRLTGGAEGSGLLPALFAWMRADPTLPVLGTCAGVILLADPQDGGEPLIHSSIDRNAYGRQQDSFQAELGISGVGDSNTFPGVFIRAPRFADISAKDKIVATHQEEVVGVRNGARLALTFHPELSDDPTFHRWLLEAALLRATA